MYTFNLEITCKVFFFLVRVSGNSTPKEGRMTLRILSKIYGIFTKHKKNSI